MTALNQARLRLGALNLGFVFLATRLTLIVHEVLGHAAVGWLFGAKVGAIELSVLAGGSANVELEDRPTATAIIGLAGIAVNLVTGLFALVFAARAQRRLPALFLALFGSCSVLVAILYLVLGLFYGSADPLELPKLLLSADDFEAYWRAPWEAIGWWLPPLLCLPFAAYWTTSAYLPAQTRFAPAVDRRSLVMTTAAALAAPVLAYAILSAASPETVGARFQEPQERAQAVRNSRRMKELRAGCPGCTGAEVIAHVLEEQRKDTSPLEHVELPVRIIRLGVCAFAGLGALVAVRRKRLEANTPARSILPLSDG